MTDASETPSTLRVLLLPLVGGLGVGAALVLGMWWLAHSLAPVEERTVLKVCRDGTLVVRQGDGEFRVVRPGALGSWPAASDKVCEG